MNKTINLIAAVDEKFGFGKDGKIPWHYPEDFKFFQTMTKGHTVIMGRKTFDDLVTYVKPGKPFLPGRECIVVTSQSLPKEFTPPVQLSVSAYEEYLYKNVRTAETISDALNKARLLQGDVFFIGGESIFNSGLNMADCVYLTFIPGDHNCDRFFPFEKLKDKFQIYNSRDGGDGLRFHTYVHNIWGDTNLPHN